MKRTGFKLKPRKPLKRTPLRKVGRVGKVNLEANQILKCKFDGTTYCEIALEGCLVSWPLQFVHRHKRAWYKGDVAKLSDYKQVVIGCQSCHEKLEHDAKLTEEVFIRLRSEE